MTKLLFNNYGLFWKRSCVHWHGTKGNPGNLLGRIATSKKTSPVNFRDQRGVYFLYDSSFKLVYVGQAGSGSNRLHARLKNHHLEGFADRWEYFSWFGTRRVNKNGSLSVAKQSSHPTIATVLDQLEGMVIETAQTPLNRQGGKLAKAEQYVQYIDTENLWINQREILDHIHEDVFEVKDMLKKLQGKPKD